jgi:hypothetical protein
LAISAKDVARSVVLENNDIGIDALTEDGVVLYFCQHFEVGFFSLFITIVGDIRQAGRNAVKGGRDKNRRR